MCRTDVLHSQNAQNCMKSRTFYMWALAWLHLLLRGFRGKAGSLWLVQGLLPGALDVLFAILAAFHSPSLLMPFALRLTSPWLYSAGLEVASDLQSPFSRGLRGQCGRRPRAGLHP